jgi:hypothetical protein
MDLPINHAGFDALNAESAIRSQVKRSGNALLLRHVC